MMKPKQNDEVLEGYLDGFSDDRLELPDSLANRSDLYRHGWENGRDDRLGQPRMPAAENRRVLAAMRKGGDNG